MTSQATVRRRIPRPVFAIIGAIAGGLGLYTLFLVAESGVDLARLAADRSGAPAWNLFSLIAIGGIDILVMLVFAPISVVLLLVAVWGLEPRQRWREWRKRSRP
jgi:hypothetical protein